MYTVGVGRIWIGYNIGIVQISMDTTQLEVYMFYFGDYRIPHMTIVPTQPSVLLIYFHFILNSKIQIIVTFPEYVLLIQPNYSVNYHAITTIEVRLQTTLYFIELKFYYIRFQFEGLFCY